MLLMFLAVDKSKSMAFSIRDKQTYAVKSMLTLGQGPVRKFASEPEWKILIYDQHGQDIISPLMSVADLRELGVTLYLPLNSSRDAIPDVPALYFVVASNESIAQICQDMQDQLYSSYYFNFISGISRNKLENLANAALRYDADAQVMKIYDQYINFISLEKHMFVLKNEKDDTSYFNLNKSNLKDHEMMSITDSIVDGLYSVFVTLGVIPIIRCPTGNAAEIVAEKLDKRLRENLRDARNSFFSSMSAVSDGGPAMSNFQRPLLLIWDRSLDLATPLHHTWTYQAMIHDVLDFQLNTVTVTEMHKEGDVSRVKKTHKYNLAQSDKFWQTNMGNPFPEVAQAVQEEIEEYKNHEEEVQRLKTAMGLAGGDGPVDISDNTARLTSAMSSLPELLEKKRLIDMHTTIATSLLSSIKDRKLDEYFEMEEKLMSKTTAEKSVMDFINDPEGGCPADKMRLFLIYFISQGSSSEQFDQFEEALQNAGCDMAPIKYIKRWKQYTMPTTNIQQQLRGGGTKTIGMFSHLMSTGSQFVMEGVKNLVVKKHNLPITKILDSLMELKSTSEIDNYRYFDPKLTRAIDQSSGRSKVPYNDAIVFVVGGGNYIEYHNLLDYIKNKTGKRVSYGCSELLNASQFLSQLSFLGNEI